MRSLGHMKRHEFLPNTPFIKLLAKGVTSVLKTSAFHLSEVKKMRVRPPEPAALRAAPAPVRHSGVQGRHALRRP